MSDVATEPDDPAPTSLKLPLFLGLMLACGGGGAGFYLTWSGAVMAPDAVSSDTVKVPELKPISDVAYVEVEPLVISLPRTASAKHLRFRANLEVQTKAAAEINKILPRIVDVLNSYLRALEPADLEDPAALARLRSQMLRRVQVVAGPNYVNDLLIMEFVLT